jgi:hypothetical protein
MISTYLGTANCQYLYSLLLIEGIILFIIDWGYYTFYYWLRVLYSLLLIEGIYKSGLLHQFDHQISSLIGVVECSKKMIWKWNSTTLNSSNPTNPEQPNKSKKSNRSNTITKPVK